MALVVVPFACQSAGSTRLSVPLPAAASSIGRPACTCRKLPRVPCSRRRRLQRRFCLDHPASIGGPGIFCRQQAGCAHPGTCRRLRTGRCPGRAACHPATRLQEDRQAWQDTGLRIILLKAVSTCNALLSAQLSSSLQRAPTFILRAVSIDAASLAVPLALHKLACGQGQGRHARRWGEGCGASLPPNRSTLSRQGATLHPQQRHPRAPPGPRFPALASFWQQ